MIDRFLYAFFSYIDDVIFKIEALVISKRCKCKKKKK